MNYRRPRALCWKAGATVLAAVLSLGFAAHAASDVPPGTPPDIAAIMRKMQRGGMPSGADIAKLQAWSQKLMNKANGSVGNGTQVTAGHTAAQNEQQGIPCSVRVGLNYNGSGKDFREVFQATYEAKAMLYPRIQGTGDYWATLLNPDAPVSAFRFELDAPGGMAAHSGGGAYHRTQTFPKGSSDSIGHYASAIFSMQLVTTGKGDLLYPSGAVGGEAVGKTTGRDDDPAHTHTFDDPSGGTPALTDPFVMEGAQLGPGKSTPAPTMNLSYRALLAAIRSGKTSTIMGTENFHDVVLGGVTYSGVSSVSITLRPKPMDILIEPVDKHLYETWEPMPDAADTNHADLFGNPKPLSFHFAMHDASRPPVAPHAGLTRPNTQTGGMMDIYLHNVSEQAGICMNFPADAASKKGLFFPHQQPAGIVWKDEQHLQTPAGAVEATVNVCARDTGAYGRIDAKCEALGVESKSTLKDAAYVPIPLDDNGNDIADQYEKDHHVLDRNLSADWDDEDKPEGWKSNGDGISLYEEYRGFLIDNPDHSETFKRLGQDKRKLFVFPTGPDKELYRKGAELYRQAAGVDVYYVHSISRLKDLGGTAFPRWINFNTTAHSPYKQAAVWIQDYDDSKAAYTKPTIGTNATIPQCPSTTYTINISRPKINGEMVEWAGLFPPNTPVENLGRKMTPACIATHIDVAAAEATVQARIPEMTNQLIVFSAAHELGHSTGGQHHALNDYLAFLDNHADDSPEAETKLAECYSSGDHDCLMRYWHYDSDWSEKVMFLAGKWNLLIPASGRQWHFCDNDLKNMHLKD